MILVYFSGGCDSSSVLIEFLKNTNYPIMAHHCILKTSRNRWPCELEAVNNIVEWCKTNLRDFEYTKSVIDVTHLPTCASQMDPLNFALTGAMQMVCDVRISSCAYGYYKYSTAHSLDRAVTTIYQSVINRKIVELYPNNNKTKKEVYDSLPDPVKGMIWWCRTPNWLDGFPEPCGNCFACKNIESVKND